MSGTRMPTGGRDDGRSPMAERLSAWAGARAAPDAADAVRALEQVSGQRPEVASKRSLIAVSHAIERAILAAPPARPTIVLALFQRMDYFERERAVYERIARTGAMVAVGFCESPAHDLPDGVAAVRIDPDEALVDEWAVVAVSPQAGAFLVATDQHGIEPGATSMEAGRRFRSRWGFSRVQATVELARLRLVLGDRLPADMVRTVDRLLGETMAAGAHPASSAGSPQEVWATTAAFHLAERLSSARTGSARLRAQLADAHAAAAARHAAGTDQQSGLTTPDFLQRWSDGEGATALPVGLGLFDLSAVGDASRGGTDSRAAYHAARRIAASMTEPLGPVDAAVRLSEREFLVVLPGASELHLARVCDEILEQLTLLSDGYPHIPLTGTLATTVTRYRPLPLAELQRAGGELGDDEPGPRTAGTTRNGDAIVVCAARPFRSADAPDTGPDDRPGDGPGDRDAPAAGDRAPRFAHERGPDTDGDRPGRSDRFAAASGDRAADPGDAEVPGWRNGLNVMSLGRVPRPYPEAERTGPDTGRTSDPSTWDTGRNGVVHGDGRAADPSDTGGHDVAGSADGRDALDGDVPDGDRWSSSESGWPRGRDGRDGGDRGDSVRGSAVEEVRNLFGRRN